jgi:hypothetical protein
MKSKDPRRARQTRPRAHRARSSSGSPDSDHCRAFPAALRPPSPSCAEGSPPISPARHRVSQRPASGFSRSPAPGPPRRYRGTWPDLRARDHQPPRAGRPSPAQSWPLRSGCVDGIARRSRTRRHLRALPARAQAGPSADAPSTRGRVGQRGSGNDRRRHRVRVPADRPVLREGSRQWIPRWERHPTFVAMLGLFPGIGLLFT